MLYFFIILALFLALVFLLLFGIAFISALIDLFSKLNRKWSGEHARILANYFPDTDIPRSNSHLYMEEIRLMKWAFIEGFESARLRYDASGLIKFGSNIFLAWRNLAKSDLDKKCLQENLYHEALRRMELDLVGNLTNLYRVGHETQESLMSEDKRELERQAQKVIADIYN